MNPSSASSSIPQQAANSAMSYIGASKNANYSPATQSNNAMNFVLGLPTPASTPTAPTGVASSALADQTLATQTQGTQKLINDVNNHAANKAAVPTFNPEVSIDDLLSSKGMSNDFNTRAKMAQKAGITDYIGSPDQNAQLIGYVNNPPKDNAASSSDAETKTSSSSTIGSTTNGTTTTPLTDSTGSPGNVYSPAITKVQSDIADALAQRNTSIQQIMSGTFPLTPYQQKLIDATKAQFDRQARLQMLANKSYEGGVALAGNRLGLNRQSPQEYLAEQQQAVTQGLQKVQDLDATAAKTLADLQQGFMDKDYTYINDTYTALQKTLTDKANALNELQKRSDTLYTSTRDYNEKVKEFADSQAQQKAEFNQTMGLERAKFTAQYAGLIDPNTGLFKPSANPSTLPGVTALPQSIGSGPGAFFLDVGQVADKGLATYLVQTAKANGFGVVDSSQNKTFNQSLSALSGLDSLIKTGAVDPNAKVADVIGNKKSSSLILRAFGSTQPDNISQILGAGGASVPNLNTMTMGQAADFLKSSIYTQMGTNTTAQKYAMNPTLASNAVADYVASSPVNAANAHLVKIKHPNFTDSQIMQYINGEQ